MKVTAIVPAAGQGKRMKGKINKQYMLLAGKPVLAHTLAVLASVPSITEIIVVACKDEISYCQKEVVDKYNISKIAMIVEGGKERQDSVHHGLLAIKTQPDLVLVHDGARPLITRELIDNAIEVAQKGKGAVCAVPMKDTVKEADSARVVTKTLKRDILWSIQTPQIFAYDELLDAYEYAAKNNYTGTDDASLIEYHQKEVQLVDGSYENIKLTTPVDLIFAEAILEGRKSV